MKNLLVPPLAVGAALAFFSVPSEAALLLYYNFNDPNLTAVDGAIIDNLVGQTDGVLRTGTTAGGTISIVDGGTVLGGNLGRSLSLTPAADGNQGFGAPHIDTNFTLAALGISTSAPYTTMAWVNFASVTGDNMIFGQGEGDVLHLGTRNGRYHSGHWAGDQTSPENVTSGVGTWQHVAFTNDEAGLQKIFVNGEEVTSGAAGTGGGISNATQQARNLLIGTSLNGGSFSGSLDEIKVYNETLNADQIRAASVIPEPSSVALLALATAGIGMIRRRRH
jgi:hypothetical protein